MMSALASILFMLEQNSLEKDITILGVTMFGFLMFFLIIDSTVKNKYIPKKGPVRGFLIFLLLLAVVAVTLLIFFYK